MSPETGVDGSSSTRTAILVALLVAVLVAGPLWVEVLHLDDREYRYERAAVTTQDGTIDYATDANDPGVPISEQVACTGAITSRACYLERSLTGNSTAPTSRYTSANVSGSAVEFDYRYVAGDGATYRVTAVLNRSQGYVVENGSVRPVDAAAGSNEDVLYRVELDLERVSPETVLDRVTVDVDDVDSPVRTAARTGSVRTHSQVDVPATPVELDDGSTYRMYLAAQHDPPATGRTAVVLLRYVAPAVGLALGYSALKRLRQDRVE